MKMGVNSDLIGRYLDKILLLWEDILDIQMQQNVWRYLKGHLLRHSREKRCGRFAPRDPISYGIYDPAWSVITFTVSARSEGTDSILRQQQGGYPTMCNVGLLLLFPGGGGGGGGGGGYSLYEGYYICSSVSTPLFQVSGKFVEFRPLYFSKNEENVVFWPLYFSKNEEMSYFDPYILAKMRKMSYFDPYFSSKLGKMYSFDPPFWPL